MISIELFICTAVSTYNTLRSIGLYVQRSGLSGDDVHITLAMQLTGLDALV